MTTQDPVRQVDAATSAVGDDEGGLTGGLDIDPRSTFHPVPHERSRSQRERFDREVDHAIPVHN